MHADNLRESEAELDQQLQQLHQMQQSGQQGHSANNVMVGDQPPFANQQPAPQADNWQHAHQQPAPQANNWHSAQHAPQQPPTAPSQMQGGPDMNAQLMQQVAMQQQQMQQMQLQMQQMAAMTQQLQTASNQGADVSQQADQVKFNADNIREMLDGLDPEWEDNKIVKQALEATLDGLEAQLAAMSHNQQQQHMQPQSSANSDPDGHGGHLQAAVPNWQSLIAEPQFQQFLNSNPDYQRIYQNGATGECIWLLQSYVQSKSGQAFGQRAPQQMPYPQQHPQTNMQPHMQMQSPQMSALPVDLATQGGGDGQPLMDVTTLQNTLHNTNDRFGEQFAQQEEQIDALFAQLSQQPSGYR